MIKVIDNLNAVTGWSGSGGGVIYGLCDNPEFIAGSNTKSLILQFTGINSYCEKTITEDLTSLISEEGKSFSANEIVLWVKSTGKGKNNYRNPSDYNYKITFGSGKEFYLPALEDFYWISFNTSEISSIETLRITALTADTDYLLISYMIASKDIFPYDILQGLKNQFEYERDNNYSLRLLGTFSGSQNDTYIEFSAPVDFLDRYSGIYIDDGVNAETHHIKKKEGNKFYLSPLYDGNKLLHDYVSASVYLDYPVEFGRTQKEIVLPSITVWGFSPEKLYLDNELSKVVDTAKTNGSVQERTEGTFQKWLILIDCEAEEEWEILGEISEIVRKVIEKKVVWINGRRASMEQTSAPVEVFPTEDVDLIPKIQYSIAIEIQEEVYIPVILPMTTTTTVTVSVQ